MSEQAKRFILQITSPCLLLLACSLSALGQPKWVNEVISNGDSVKISGDPPAIILAYQGVSAISRTGSAKSHYQKAIKILEPKGTERAIMRVATDPLRSIKNFKGWRIESDGKVHQLKKEYVIEIGFAAETGYYDDQKNVVATFPELKTGDVVAFEYDFEEKPGWEGYSGRFVFQSDLPVVESSFELTIPNEWYIRTSKQHLEPVFSSNTDNVYSWTAGFLDFRPEEPYMPEWTTESRVLGYSCYSSGSSGSRGFETWRDVADWTRKIYENETLDDVNLKQVAAEIKGKSTSSHEQLTHAAKWMQENIRYVAVEFGIGRFKPRSAAATLTNRYGDCKDKSELMRAILAEIGINSQPVLANLGGNVNENEPSPAQFNHVILSIPINSIDSHESFQNSVVDGWLYFDPTDPVTPIGCLPTDLHGSKVLNVAHSEDGLVYLPALSPAERKRAYYAKAEVFDDNAIIAKVRIVDYGVRANETKSNWRSLSEKDHVNNLKSFFSAYVANVAIDGIERLEDNDSAWTEFALSGAGYLSQSSDLTLLKLDLFHSDQNNQLTRATRIHPILFSEPGMVLKLVEWKLPPNLALSGQIDSIKASLGGYSVSSVSSFERGIIELRQEIIYSGEVIPHSQYEFARQFEKQLNASHSQRVFLSKK